MTPEKKVTQIELYRTLALILNQPQEAENKYFSHNPHFYPVWGDKSDRTAFIDRIEYSNFSRWFV